MGRTTVLKSCQQRYDSSAKHASNFAMPSLKVRQVQICTAMTTESLNAVLKLWFDHCDHRNKESFCHFGTELSAQNESRVVYDQWVFFLFGGFARGPSLVLGLGNDSWARGFLYLSPLAYRTVPESGIGSGEL